MQTTLLTGIDSNFHSKLTFKMCNRFDKPVIKAAICKINNFSIVTSIFPKCYCTQLSCAKKGCEEI